MDNVKRALNNFCKVPAWTAQLTEDEVNHLLDTHSDLVFCNGMLRKIQFEKIAGKHYLVRPPFIVICRECKTPDCHHHSETVEVRPSNRFRYAERVVVNQRGEVYEEALMYENGFIDYKNYLGQYPKFN